MKLTKPARVGNLIFNIGDDVNLVIGCAQQNYMRPTQDYNLPSELICLSCLATQSTVGVIKRGNSCFSCENTINPYNLSDIEV